MSRLKSTKVKVTYTFTLSIKVKRDGNWYEAKAVLPNGKEMETVGFTRKEVVEDLVGLLIDDGYDVSPGGK